MGQKVHPKSFRLGVIGTWRSRWFGKKNFHKMLEEDTKIRRYVQKKLKDAGVADVIIQRSPRLITVIVLTSRPGLIIGRGGSGAEELRSEVKQQINASEKKIDIKINIEEIRNPYANAELVAQSVVEQLEKRMPFRRILKQTIEKVIEAKGVQGVKVALGGRLNGSEMGRREWLSQGNIPLHTIRADIDFARATAATTYGAVGVKVWIYKGEIFEEKRSVAPQQSKK
jgi:small subunit ribosomal protein S3